MARTEVDLGPVDAYAIAVAEGYTGTREQWVQALADAEANALKAEGYAVGEQNGTPVASGEYFENNAKYYNEQAQSAKEDAETAQTAAETAQTAAETAQTAAETAQTAAETAAARDTAAWLNEHITNPDSPPLDRTLMSSSAAAPADMVGELKSAINAFDVIVDEPSIAGKSLQVNGNIADVPSLQTYKITNVISIPENAYGISVVGKIGTNIYLSAVAFYKSDTPSVSTCVGTVTYNGANIFQTIPNEAKYCVFSSNVSGNGTDQGNVERRILCKEQTIHEKEIDSTIEYIISGINSPTKQRVVTPEWISWSFIKPDGTIVSVPSLQGFKRTDFISLNDADTTFSIQATNIQTNNAILMVAFYQSADTGTFISGVSPSQNKIFISVPEKAKYMIIGSNTSGNGTYTELNADIYVGSVYLRDVPPENEMTASLKLPDHYDLIVGDTFELFYKGIINGINSDCFYVSTSCSIGAGYKKRYIVTPTTTGTYQLTLKLYDQNNNIIDQETVALVVHSTPTNPLSLRNILCVGDSLTQNGVWVGEMKRRLCGSGGTPVAYNLSNVSFIGTCYNEGVNYEGYGGFTFEKYNTNYLSPNERKITCTHDKTEALDQHSIYQDSAGNKWKLETINANDIIIILSNGTASTIPTTGVLTWVSGGVNHSPITYTAVSGVSGNPFWDTSLNSVSFSSYASNIGASSIDYVYVLLGWNNWGSTMDYIKTQAQIFISNVHNDFPNAKIVLIGLEIPSLDGLGANYGSYTGVLSNYVSMMQFVHDLDAMYDELVLENSNVYHMNLSGQFDTEHNMPESTRTVNTRNDETEVYQTNGIHPARSGSLQIADSTTRHIVGIM